MTLKLAAKTRTNLGKKAQFSRLSGQIPAVLYGHGLDNRNLEMSLSEFEKIFGAAGENTILDLAIDNQAPIKVLIQDVQNDPVNGRPIHVDLHQIRMDEKISAHVTLKFIGESKLVKEENGMFIHNISEVEIRCLPDDLIHEIDVDISILNNFDDAITINDLRIPVQVEIVGHSSEDVVALVTRHREEKEEIPVTAPEVAAAAEAAVEEGSEKKEEKSNSKSKV